MVWRFVLPVWVVGVVLSFALPFVPPWWAWLSVIIGTLALCRRFAVAWLVLAVCVGMAFWECGGPGWFWLVNGLWRRQLKF